MARECLSVSQSIVNQVELDLDGAGNLAIDKLSAAWNRTNVPYQGSYLCVIEPTGRLSFHSKKPEMIGTDVSRVIVNPASTKPLRVPDLIATRESLAAQNINYRGKPQLAGYCYMPSIDSLVVVHVPAKLVESKIDATTAPWIAALLLIGFLFVPLSIALTYLTFQKFHNRTEKITSELIENESLLRDQFFEIELLYRTAPVGLCLVDKDQRFVRINEELATISGRAVEDHIGRTVSEVLPDLADRLKSLYQTVIDTGEPTLNLEVDRIDPESKTEKLNFVISCYPLKNNDGSVMGVSTVVQNVTDRRRAGAEMRIRQETIDRSVMPTCFSNEKFQITYANQAFSDLFGFESPQRILGKNITEFVSQNGTLSEINRALTEDDKWTREVKSSKVDGKPLDVFVHASVLRDPLNVPICTLTTVWDITKRKMAQEQLRLTQYCVDSCTTSIFWIRKDASFFYVNDFATECFGYQADEWPSMSVHDIDPDYPAEVWPSVWNKFQETKTQTFETNIRHRDGELIPVEISINHMEFEGQEFAFAFVTDISKRRKSEEERRSSDAKFRALVENSNDAINMFNAQGELFYTSPAITRMLGYQPEELMNISPFKIIHPDDVEQADAELREYAETPGAVGHFVQRLKHKNGTYRTVEVTGTNMLNEPGINAMVSILRDITDRTIAEQKLRERESQLAHVSRLSSMGEMVAGIAHEIKQPMHAISNFAVASSVALDNIKGNEATDLTELELSLIKELLEWNERIRNSSHRAAEIVGRLRDFACKTEEQRKLESISELLNESIEIVAYNARQSKIELTTNITSDLPNVVCDRIQIQQVLVNLLNNAYDELASQPKPRRVVVEILRDNNELEVQIVDNGPGISQEVSRRIFDAFYTTKPKGMGMGLAVSRTIIEAHYGKIWATGNIEGGTTFHFTLPINDELSSKQLVTHLRNTR